jgi:hypothetical protein
MVEALGIAWKRGDAYDEWDDLASCMYQQLVGSIVGSLREPTSETPVHLAAYDMMLREYRECATIDVHNDSLGPGRWVFHAFGSDAEPFDIIEVREVSTDAVAWSEQLRTCPLVGSRFSIFLPNGSRSEHVDLYSEG